MSETVYEFLSLDLPALTAATLAALTCGLLGNFLVLRRLSLMGDAISHAVLPGLVVAFLVTQMRTSLPMFLGAMGAGIVTALLVELVRKLGRLESGAAMGVVFSILFALGVLLMERAAAANVDLDAECVLHGQLETIFWFPPRELGQFFSINTLSLLPRQVMGLALMTLLVVVFIACLYKELRISAFDPELASALGIPASLMHYLLMIMVAAAAVASFEAVGSILVVAMLICPAATARLLTDRLLIQILLSAVVAVLTGVGGYALGAFAPTALGLGASLNAAGMMTVVAAVLLLFVIACSPTHGLLAKRLRRRRLQATVAAEDLLGHLYRREESGDVGALQLGDWTRVDTAEVGTRISAGRAAREAQRRRWVRREGDRVFLTDPGRNQARAIVRSHRLWETYLAERVGLRPDHVHDTAELLEHLRSEFTPDRLHPSLEGDVDPHGRPIPRPGEPEP